MQSAASLTNPMTVNHDNAKRRQTVRILEEHSYAYGVIFN